MMGRVDLLLLRRVLPSLTLASGVLVVLTLATAPVFGAPMAALFVVSVSAWNLLRAESTDRRSPSTAGDVCGGCTAGCVECRERIEV